MNKLNNNTETLHQYETLTDLPEALSMHISTRLGSYLRYERKPDAAIQRGLQEKET